MPTKPATLHAAIRTVLREQPTKSASTRMISEEIARRDLYRRKDGDRAPDWQIGRRAKRFPKHFEVRGETVRLIKKRPA